ncbi:SMP-30/gluconolactonase/LRE family protein [Fibrella sp. HMF5335]|uniref:SMP-30/gluconolactonase/LRE family protein n=1 Tax=Fibrella rubiginis TaxID=2817060 RepID=A0A939GIS8_9BACT|nr:SMP-30/gluconolactonase/LRE family protein [Fibrella rubiginis]MBO0937521.1 SMP-30/gluconolactonase/LRE family protein [Fibrella rubiginis]
MNRYLLTLGLLASGLAGCQQTKKADTATSDTTTSIDSASARNNPADTGGPASGQAVPTVGSPVLLTKLPAKYNTPDGLALAPDGTVYLSMPNLANNTYPGVLLKIVGDSVQLVSSLPAHPDTKHACPMDLAFGPDGNLYYADNQYENSKDFKSRLMRIDIKNGKVGAVTPVVTGFGLSNAVVWRGNTIYVTDSEWNLGTKPGDDKGSAVFHFTLDELNKGEIKLKPNTIDPHVLATFTTTVNETGLDNGADGLDYDEKGNFYTGTFGDGTLYKLTLKPDGSLAKKEKLTVNKAIPCVDGLIIDRATNTMYLCNSRENAIMTVNLINGNVATLAQNGDTDGHDGRLDQPAEVLLKGKRLYISEYDKPEKAFVNTKADEVHTMSYIDLK